jgi:hypothetical protein
MTNNNQHAFYEALQEHVKAEVRKKVEAEFDNQLRYLQTRKEEIVASTLLEITKHVEFAHAGQMVTFSIRRIDVEKPV